MVLFSPKLSQWLSNVNKRDFLSVVSLLSLSVGCGLAWPPLSLMVPGALVFFLCVYSHMRDN